MAQSIVSKIMEGISQTFWAGGRHTEAMLVGCDQVEECDVSAGNATPAMTNCRCISADVEGLVKVQVTEDSGATHTEVLTVPTTWIPVRNVTLVYRYYVGTTEATAQIYTSAGAAKIGIKIRR